MRLQAQVPWSYGRGGDLDSVSSLSSPSSSSSCFGWSCCAACSGEAEVGAEDAVTETAAEFRRSLKNGTVVLTASPVQHRLQERQRLSVKQILVVEDESRIARIVRDYLERAGYSAAVVGNGVDALTFVRTRRPDLIVLDLGLPEMGGLEFTKAVRKQSSVPIVMLTARVEERDKLVGLELGADDYITKPFSPKELVARVRAVFRRIDPLPDPSMVIRAGDIELDRLRMRVSIHDRQIEVTPTEFELLATLARQPGRVFTRAQLLDAVRGLESESFDRAVDVHVKNLRHKLEPDSRNPRYVITVYGVGYKFSE
jgi:two-component system alkaline phosphatase synthesis response regulator PhoP